jgi:nicotinamidase/pyrazinamidase
MSKVLFCIDIQVDHFPMGMLEIKNSDTLIDSLNKRINEAQHVIYFRSSFPANHIRFAGNHLWRKPGGSIEINKEHINLWPMYCIESSWGSEYHPKLHKKENFHEILRGKNKDVNPKHLWEDSDKLFKLLNELNIQEIEISGILSEQALIKNSIDYLESNGFIVNLNESLTRTEVIPFS